jgi:hypothetical protein
MANPDIDPALTDFSNKPDDPDAWTHPSAEHPGLRDPKWQEYAGDNGPCR